MNNKNYVFIMGHPRSGSTLLQALLKTSPEVTSLPMEGLKMITELEDYKNIGSYWDKNLAIDFQQIKDFFHIYWNADKSVYLEKSPPLILHFKAISETFKPFVFLCLIRNPYAYTSSVKARFPDSSTYYIARFWLYMVKRIIEGFEQFKERSLLIKYEDLATRTDEVTSQILKLLPNIKTLDSSREFNIHNRKSEIRNLNKEYIDRLTPRDLYLINKALKRDPNMMEFLGYDFIKPFGNHGYAVYFEIIPNFFTGHHSRLLRKLL